MANEKKKKKNKNKTEKYTGIVIIRRIYFKMSFCAIRRRWIVYGSRNFTVNESTRSCSRFFFLLFVTSADEKGKEYCTSWLCSSYCIVVEYIKDAIYYCSWVFVRKAGVGGSEWAMKNKKRTKKKKYIGIFLQYNNGLVGIYFSTHKHTNTHLLNLQWHKLSEYFCHGDK